MATLTYDPSETKEGELTEEEQNSLEVGEKMAEQQEQMLAGKFKTAEDLEQGYIELQKKLGEPKEEKAEPEAKEEEVKEEKEEETDTSFLNTLWDEAKGGKFNQETLDKLGGMDAREIAQMYLKERSEAPEPQQTELSDDNIKQLKGVVGGEDQYGKMMQWAGSNLTEKEREMYDSVMGQGNPLAAYFAVQALKYRFDDSNGVDGEMLQGKAAKSEGTKFASQAQVVKAMEDPRYEKDPAYRQEIYDKLERSNINF
tara:strand:+ start:336 stop:1103 length:768 start_codon:yes stop_codon:yes gene_type:complete